MRTLTSFINSNSRGYVIGTGTPDYKKSTGDYMTLEDVKNWYRNNVFVGNKQKISNKINDMFIKTLKWANDNNEYATLNPLCKKIIENYTLKMKYYEILPYKDPSSGAIKNKFGKMPSLLSVNSIHDIRNELSIIIY